MRSLPSIQAFDSSRPNARRHRPDDVSNVWSIPSPAHFRIMLRGGARWSTGRPASPDDHKNDIDNRTQTWTQTQAQTHTRSKHQLSKATVLDSERIDVCVWVCECVCGSIPNQTTNARITHMMIIITPTRDANAEERRTHTQTHTHWMHKSRRNDFTHSQTQ